MSMEESDEWLKARSLAVPYRGLVAGGFDERKACFVQGSDTKGCIHTSKSFNLVHSSTSCSGFSSRT